VYLFDGIALQFRQPVTLKFNRSKEQALVAVKVKTGDCKGRIRQRRSAGLELSGLQLQP
jgi:hypothetical protein